MISIKIIAYLLMFYGLVNMLIYGDGLYHCLTKLRKFVGLFGKTFKELFECPMCLSGFGGLVMSLVNVFLITLPFTPFNILYGTELPWYLIIFFDAGITSGFVWLVHTFQEMMERFANG
jgi:hypothetical protein